MTRYTTCRCGRRALAGQPCECGAGLKATIDETQRTARLPYRRHYTSAEYRRNRKLALERTGGRCALCGQPATNVDHIVPVRDGGTSELGNLAPLCDEHHKLKTKADRRMRRQ